MIQMVTPLPPAQSGIAQYSSDLLNAVDGSWYIRVFPENPGSVERWSSVRVAGDGSQARFDPEAPVVYQLGNSGHHRRAFALARTAPGVLVLHDVVLHHGRLGEYLRARGGGEYRRALIERYGQAGGQVAEAVLRGQTPEELGEFPLFEDYVERARVTLVHSEFARQRVLARVPGADVRRVPMGIPLPAAISSCAARRALGLPEAAFVVASVTHINPYKRLPVVLRAVRRIVRRVPETLVLIAGSVAPTVELGPEISYLGLAGHVRMLGYVSDATARLVAAAADVCVNLRYPSAGETSASLLRLLGAGRPVIVTDDAPNAEYPDQVVLKLTVDRFEEETLAALLLELREDRALATARGQLARGYVATEHTMGAAVAGYRTALRDAYGLDLPDLGPLPMEEPAAMLTSTQLLQSTVVEQLLAERIGGLGLEWHEATLDALAGAVRELRLDAHSSAGVREDVTMEAPRTISPELLEILACPVCKTAVHLVGEELICDACGRRYQIEDGIPIMVIDDEN